MYLRPLARLALLIAILGLSACLPSVSAPVSSTSSPSIKTLPSSEQSVTPILSPSPLPLISTTTATCTPSPSPTSTPEALPTPAPCAHALYRQSCYDSNVCRYLSWDPGNDPIATPWLASPAIAKPVDTADVAFANFDNRMAYWTDTSPGQWWISDLDLQQPELIFTDTTGTYPYEKVQLFWSPDDLHVILEVEGESLPGRIYHVQTKMQEEWPWKCDRVATSPRTAKLALWCSPIGAQREDAVIEWRGDIWYSEQPPTTEIVHRLDDQPPSWAWSSDGQQVAFLNPAKADWPVSIADAAGIHTTLPLSTNDPRGLPWHWTRIQWSSDGQRLLFQADGTAEFPCPLHKAPIGGPPDQEATPIECWQIVDAETGQVVWNTGVSSDGISKLLATSPEPDSTLWYSDAATISPDGKMVAFTLNTLHFSLVLVVDLSSGQVYMMDGWSGDMRWCNR